MNGVANLIDGYVNEWPDALEKLKAIDFVDVIPRATASRSRARNAWTDAGKRIDMTAHKAHHPTISGPGVNLPAVSRMFAVMEHRADQ